MTECNIKMNRGRVSLINKELFQVRQVFFEQHFRPQCRYSRFDVFVVIVGLTVPSVPQGWDGAGR